jgi:ABC-type glycerol-3-phosphate transport system substrate-binding protein
MKRNLAFHHLLLLTLLTSTCFTGCSSTPTVAPDVSEPEVAPTASQPDAGSNATQPGIEPEDSVIITFAADSYEAAYYEGLARSFHQEHPTISVQINTIEHLFEYGEEETLRSLASLADTVIYDGNRTKLLDHPEYFLDLTSLFDVTSDFDAADFWGTVIYGSQDNEGRIIGLPISLGLMGIYFDSQSLRDSGVALPEPGWTMDDLHAILCQADMTMEDLGLLNSLIAPYISYTLDQNGGEVNSSELVSIVRDYVDLYQSGKIQMAGTSNNENKMPALWVGALTSDVPSGEDEKSITSYSFAPYPAISGSEDVPTNIIFPAYGLISAGSDYPREAWLWLNYLSYQAPGNVLENTIPYSIPARKSVAEESFPWELIPTESQQAIRNALEHGWYGNNFPQTFEAIIDALSQVLQGQLILASAFTNLIIAEPPTPDSTPIVLTTPEIAPEITSGEAVIRFLYPPSLPNGGAVYQALANEYEEAHPGVFIELSSDFSWPGGNPFPYMAESFDCFYDWGNSSPDIVMESVTDLSPFLEHESSEYVQDFLPGRIDGFTSNGFVYGLPVSNSLSLVKYNAALLNELGIEPPNPNWTFDDLLRLLKEVAVKSANREIYGSSNLEKYLLNGFGAQFYELDQEPVEININTPETLQAFYQLLDMIQNRELYFPGVYSYATLQNLITNGQIAVWMSYTHSQTTTPFETGTLPVPAIDGESTAVGWSIPSTLYISAASEVKPACWDWIRFLSDQPNAFAEVPVRQSALSSPDYIATVGEELATVYRLGMTNAVNRGDVNMVTRPIDSWITAGLLRMIKGESPQVVLADIQTKAEGFANCLASYDLMHEVIYGVSVENKEIRNQIGQCALEVDPEFNLFGYE